MTDYKSVERDLVLTLCPLKSSSSSESVPKPMCGHAAAQFDNALLVYGGLNEKQFLADTWRCDIGVCCSRCEYFAEHLTLRAL